MPIVDRTRIDAVDWSLKLGAPGEIVEGVDDVEQCIRIVVGTPKGSVPHRVEFGCDLWRFLDQPIAHARPGIVREVVDAIAHWEPRATVLSVEAGLTAEGSSQGDGAVSVVITWRLAGTAAAPVQTAFTLARPA